MAKVPTPTLQTPRLTLRPASLQDCSELQPLFADWEVVKELNAGVPWPYPEDGVLTFTRDVLLPAMADGDSFSWTLLETSSQRAVGRLELVADPDPGELHRGFWLGRPFWGRGYMSEAVLVTTDFAFDVLRLPLLRLGNAQRNRASSRMKQKSGARLLGVEPCDYVCGQLPAERWELSPEAWRVSPMKAVPAP